MKFRLAFILFLFSCLFAEGQSSVQFNLNDPQFGISQTTNATITVRLWNTGYDGNLTLSPISVVQITGVNGSATFTNLWGATNGGVYNYVVSLYNSSQKFSGNFWVSSTNLGVVPEGLIDVIAGAPTFPYGFPWCYSAVASDMRYALSTNNQLSFVQIGQLLAVSNSLALLIPSTNGFVTSAITNGFATTNFVTNALSGFTTIVYSNPAIFATPTSVTNIVNALANTNIFNLTTVSNIANSAYSNNPAGYLQTPSFTSGTNAVQTSLQANIVSTGQVLASSIGSLGISLTNALTNAITITSNSFNGFATTSSLQSATNNAYTTATANLQATNSGLLGTLNTASNSLQLAIIGTNNILQNSKQPASTTLTNLAATGAFTNALAAGQNITITTNAFGTIVSLNATNQTFLTNGLLSLATANTLYDTNGAGIAASMIVSNIAYSLAAAGSNNVANASNSITSNPQFFDAITNGASYQVFLENVVHVLAPMFVSGGLAISGGSLTSLHNIEDDTSGNSTVAGDLTVANGITNTGNAPFSGNGAGLTNLLSADTNGAANNAYVRATNVVFSQALNFVPLTNGTITSGEIISNLMFGVWTNFQPSSTIIGIKAAGIGAANGPYDGISPNWTNYLNTNFVVMLTGGNYYVQSNGVSLYASPTGNGFWTVVAPNGVAPAPFGINPGIWFHTSNLKFVGVVDATNLVTQWTATIAVAPLNASQSNTVEAMIIAAGGPTNGVTATTVTNIVLSFNYVNQTQLIACSNALVTLINSVSGVTLTTVTNISTSVATSIANNVAMGNILFGPPTNTIFSAGGTNAINGLVQGNAVGGVVAGTVASESFSAAGTNSIITLINNQITGGSYIGANNGNGTNTTIYKTLTATNISGSFLHISDAQNVSIAQQSVSSGNAAIASDSQTVGQLGNERGLSYISSVNAQSGNNDVSFLASENSLQGGVNSFSVVMAGDQQTNYGNESLVAGTYVVNSNFNSFIWSDGNTATPFYTATNDMVALHANNGVAINTVSAAGYTLNVSGPVNSAAGYYVNGAPIGSGQNQNAGLTEVLVTNPGTNTTVGGTYFTDNYGYSFLVLTNAAGWSISPVTFASIPGSPTLYTMAFPSIVSGSPVYCYTNGTLIGTYAAFNADTNRPVVSYITNAPPFSPSSYLLAGAGGNTDGGGLTNVNAANLGGVLAATINNSVNTNVYNVLAFGAIGHGHFVSDVFVTNLFLYSPNGYFSNYDVGDRIGICAAQTNAMTFFTSISNVFSPTFIGLSNAAPVGITNGYYCVYGTNDDTPGIQAAINACTNSGGGKVYIPPGVYLLEGAFQLTNQNNAQIIIPFINALSGPYYNNSATIEIYGNHPYRLWGRNGTGYLNPSPEQTVLVPMVIGNDNTSTNGIGSSVFDCRPYNVANVATTSSGHNTWIWPVNDVCVKYHDIAIVSSYDPHLAAINNMGAVDGSGMNNVEIIGGSVSGNAFSTYKPVSTNSYGYICPGNTQGTFGESHYDVISGFYSGIEVGCFDGTEITVNECLSAYDVFLSIPPYFGSHVANISDCPNILTGTRGSAGSGGDYDIQLAQLQATTTGSSGWWTNVNNYAMYVVNDPNGNIQGEGQLFIINTNIDGGGMYVTNNQEFNGIMVSYLSGNQPTILHYMQSVAFDGGMTASSAGIPEATMFTNNPIFLSGANTIAFSVFPTNAYGSTSDQVDMYFGTRSLYGWDERLLDNAGYDPFPVSDFFWYAAKAPGSGGFPSQPAFVMTTNGTWRAMSGFSISQQTWSIAFETNGMQNGDNKLCFSNGTSLGQGGWVGIVVSNGTAIVTEFGSPGGGIIP